MLRVDEIKQFMQEVMFSPKMNLAKTGQKYYEAEHDILQYRMFYFNSDGKLVEDTMRSNAKIPHPFFTELVDQCTQYMLSSGEKIVRSDIPELQEELDKYFDDEFVSELEEVLNGVQTKGWEYLFAYMNKDGNLKFQCADSLNVAEVREKDTDDGCAYVIYWYVDRITKENRTITRIQVWDDSQTYFYVQDADGNIEPDMSEEINPRPHVIYTKDDSGDVYYDNFGFIPWFRIDNNKKQITSLKPVKPLIDDYDLMSCGMTNNLVDFDNPIHVVKGFEGDNLDELQQNLKTKKIIGVGDAGGLEVQTISVPYEARKIKMEEDEKNIYRFGMGFNSSLVGDGNITNIVIKSRYALLDLKCNKLSIRLKKLLKQVVEVVLMEINRVNGTDYLPKDVWFCLDREIMTNAKDNAEIEKIDAERHQVVINTLLGLQNIIDDETIIQNICDELDIDYEEIKNRLPERDPSDGLQTAIDTLDGDLIE